MKDRKKVALGVGIAGVISTVIYLATRAKAVPPPIPPEGIPTIIDTTWQPKWIGGSLGGWLVKGSLTVSSPRDFSGKVVVSIPGKVIAKNDLINFDQYQALLSYYEEKLSQCTDATCRHHYQIVLERVYAFPQINGFYEDIRQPTQEERIEDHIEDLGVGVASKEWGVSFPAGESTFPFAFFLKPDETHYSEEWWRIRYDYGIYQYSPEVQLYENTTLVDDVIYENGITFQVGNAWPVSISIPAQIPSGGEFWAEHTVHLAAGTGYEYSIYLTLEGMGKICTAAKNEFYHTSVDHCRNVDRDLKFSSSGDYTIRGIDCVAKQGVELYQGYAWIKPAEAVWIRHLGVLTYEYPLPLGIYKVYSRCILRAEDRDCHVQWSRTLWSGIYMGEVEIV